MQDCILGKNFNYWKVLKTFTKREQGIHENLTKKDSQFYRHMY